MRSFLLLLIFIFAAGDCTRAADRPNILFIMSDDHAAHAISAYGSQVNQTPQLDRLANQGMRFDRCYSVNAICTPSRTISAIHLLGTRASAHCTG